MKKFVYLELAILGAVVPYIFFVGFMSENGVSLLEFTRQLFANGAAGGFTADLLITSLVFWIWSFGEANRHQMRNWWLYVAVNLLIGLSCALPLFLFFRQLKIESRSSSAAAASSGAVLHGA